MKVEVSSYQSYTTRSILWTWTPSSFIEIRKTCLIYDIKKITNLTLNLQYRSKLKMYAVCFTLFNQSKISPICVSPPKKKVGMYVLKFIFLFLISDIIPEKKGFMLLCHIENFQFFNHFYYEFNLETQMYRYDKIFYVWLSM